MKKNELDKLIICKKCHTLHRKIRLHQGTKARCRLCDTVLYRDHKNLIDTTLALSLVSLISLVIAFSFSILTININGIYQSLDMSSIFVTIFEHKQYLVGVMLAFLIFLFPVSIFVSIVILLTLMKLKRSGYLVKRLLILVAKLLPWSMIDIFFISILVAMVKLFDFAQLELGIGFGAFSVILLLNLFILKRINISDIWEKYDYIYGARGLATKND
ncbi:paraquat-inducible protein A [Sulfurovum sp. bin170]|uniref:paraquat-inducible protein A n=1 Tax=Sulfurovum sp. bin170 TaxID=2695268 RepID=UPI0013DF52AF|nr:paraquat-inducible protein A [Sulfurovum sp. bin170]NEW60589.1 paraquat-inducible protein A [Sulfurovum sp. bin170]